MDLWTFSRPHHHQNISVVVVERPEWSVPSRRLSFSHPSTATQFIENCPPTIQCTRTTTNPPLSLPPSTQNPSTLGLRTSRFYHSLYFLLILYDITVCIFIMSFTTRKMHIFWCVNLNVKPHSVTSKVFSTMHKSKLQSIKHVKINDNAFKQYSGYFNRGSSHNGRLLVDHSLLIHLVQCLTKLTTLASCRKRVIILKSCNRYV